MSDGYLDIVVFITDHKGQKKPKTIGWAKIENGEAKGRIDLTPTNGWDGSFKIQERREQGSRLQGAPDRRAPSASKPEWGRSGYGANAKHTGTPEVDPYGDGTADAYHDASDPPF